MNKSKTTETEQIGGDVYTMAEAARLKGVSYHTVSRAVRRGKLPAQRLGRMALISTEDLREWRPMRERAPRKYRRREPNPEAAPVLLDLASGERVDLANRLATMYEMVHAAASSESLADFLGLAADRFASALGLKRVAIWRLDDENENLGMRVASYGPPISMVPGSAWVEIHEELKAAYDLTEPTIVANAGMALNMPDEDLLDVEDIFVAPLKVGDRRLGAVMGDRSGEPLAPTADQMAFARNLAGITAMAIDRARLTDRARLEGDRLAAVMDSVDEAVVIRDSEGQVVLANESARALLGLRPGAREASFRNASGAPVALEATPTYEALRGVAVESEALMVTDPEGAEIPVSFDAEPLSGPDGIVAGVVTVGRRLERMPEAGQSAPRAEVWSRA
ncbi:MAG: helix-turn-helix domain-containing protein [Thermomicrobiales bacterium]|nr:helix-turn-helix domain-containing protein [Thermomicrobiales bacterium]